MRSTTEKPASDDRQPPFGFAGRATNRQETAFAPVEQIKAEFWPSFHLANALPPRIENPCFLRSFSGMTKERYLSDGETVLYYTWYKMTEKPIKKSIAGKYGQKSPIGTTLVPGCQRTSPSLSKPRIAPAGPLPFKPD